MAGPWFCARRSSSPICAFPPSPFRGRREGAHVVKTPGCRGEPAGIFTSFSEPLLVRRLEKTELGSWEDTPLAPQGAMEPSDPRGWSLPFAGRVRAASRHRFPALAGALWRDQAAGHPRGGMRPVQRKGAELHPGWCSPGGSRAQGGAGSDPAAVGRTELEHPHPEWGGRRPAVSGVSAQVSGGGSWGAKVGCRRSRTRLRVGPGSQVSG